MLTVMHRLLLLQLRASQKLPLMRWPLLYETLIAVASFLGREEILVLPCAGEAAIRLLQVINLLIATGDSLFPSGALFESFAYEIVRQHRIFETLYRLGKKHTKQLTGALSFARSMIVQALQHLGQLDENANEVTSSEALKTIQKIQLQVQPPRVHGELPAITIVDSSGNDADATYSRARCRAYELVPLD
ncbi:MAG: hypothetical protein SGPRY_009095 [Prymnesium sp.]